MSTRGRPFRDTIQIRVRVLNSTRVIIERLAKEQLPKNQNGNIGARPGANMGIVIDKLVEGIKTEEPAYLRLAREAGLRPS